MIGISLIDLRIKIDINTNKSTTINITMIIIGILLELEISQYALFVIHETIDAKIKREIPLLIPFSVINSPIHIRSTLHTVIANAAKRTVDRSVLIIFPPNI